MPANAARANGQTFEGWQRRRARLRPPEGADGPRRANDRDRAGDREDRPRQPRLQQAPRQPAHTTAGQPGLSGYREDALRPKAPSRAAKRPPDRGPVATRSANRGFWRCLSGSGHEIEATACNAHADSDQRGCAVILPLRDERLSQRVGSGRALGSPAPEIRNFSCSGSPADRCRRGG